ncbi:MAG TPA: methyltransferase domain-containing protein [Candidatus Didemnitutus sp.]|nr:methyltransferase domain-containing protein [Candidatus Didemnitutus sp.]
MIADSTPVQAGQLRTDFVSFPNRTGLRLAACLDHTGDLTGRPWVIVAPKYGETKKNNLQLSYYLASNGLNVLRFDQTNHLGESEGRMQDFSLPGAVDDILGCLDFLGSQYQAAGAVLISNSLSARCAYRAAARDSRITRVISVVGVVNMQSTLREVYKDDIFGTYLAGRHWGLTDILGFDINGEIFLGTAVEAGMHDLAGTITDIARIRVPMVYFFAMNDTWVTYDDVLRATENQPMCRLIAVEGAMHEVRENPRAAEGVFRQIIWACRHDTAYPGDEQARLEIPDMKLILAQNRQERERMRRSEAPAESEHTFWSGYLEKYSVLEKSEDYHQYIALLGRLCAFRPGALVLDAGCGNGMFGLWALREALTQRRVVTARDLPAMYVGIDLTERGLGDAVGHHRGALRKGAGELAHRASPGTGYLRFDFNDLLDERGGPRLPFADQTFDVVCCSLVLSYLKRPQALLKELARVAKPGAVLVTSSMKPHCDMSVIYRDFMAQQVTSEELEAARDLLRAASKIRLKEEVGHYAFFSDTELAALASEAGFSVQESFHSLGNQAIVIKAQK